MKIKIKLLGFFILILNSCASICDVAPITKKIEEKSITFKKSKIPCNKVVDYQKAIEQVIEAVYSKKFELMLTEHIKNNIGKGKHEAAWKGVVADVVVKKMREQLDGTFVETYGGIKGLWLNVFYGNIAFDGTKNGPILLNRIPLKKRSSGSIANTIAHETAHRIGLTHPNSNDDLKVAEKEPPYVIGDIIEIIVNEM